MGLFNIIDPALNAIFSPLFKIPSIAAIFILSLLVTFIITIIYKYTTDQALLKNVKEQQKKLQDEMKKHRDNPKKLMKLQREAMSSSMEMMRESFKSMLYTFIPILILFGWIATHFAFSPLSVGEEFNVTIYAKDNTKNVIINTPEGLKLISEKNINFSEGKASFLVKAEKEGIYNLTFEESGVIYDKKVVVGNLDSNLKDKKLKQTWIDFIYGSSEGYLGKGNVYQIEVKYDRIKPFGDFSFFGWHPGWLGTYIIFSLVLSIVLRKVMNVY